MLPGLWLWLLYLIVCLFSGLAVSSIIKIRFSLIERILFSFVVGSAVSVWITLLISWLYCALATTSIIVSIIICGIICCTIFILNHFRVIYNTTLDERNTIVFFLLLILYLMVMNLYGVLRPDGTGNLYAFHTVWADYPFHTSIITSIVYTPGFHFPPPYTQFLHTELHYPFLMDFYSAILMKGGLTLRGSIILPNILFQLSLLGLFYFLAYRLTGLRMAGAIGSILFIFAGFPPGLQTAGIHFLNPVYAVLMPQRTAMFGMALSFAIFILLFEALSTLRWHELLIAGSLIGMLPYIHAHSFIVNCFVLLMLVPVILKKGFDNGHNMKRVIIVFLPLVVLALPQVLCIKSGVTERFFNFFPGWTDANRGIITGLDWSTIPGVVHSTAEAFVLMLNFWAKNSGALFILLSLGLFKVRNTARIFYLPFLCLFFIANFVKFQPWYFDNYKIFIYWLALSAAIAPLSLSWVNGRKRGMAVSICVLIVASTVFGVITHAEMVKDEYMVWSSDDRAVACWLRHNTLPGGLFLTGSAHNHPVTALAGRQRVMGYEGWLWSHGLNWTRITGVKHDEIEMFKGNHSLIKEYGIDYISIGPYERSFAADNHFKINYKAFDDRTRFRLLYDDKGWKIYEVLYNYR